jgi:hypothetical protein
MIAEPICPKTQRPWPSSALFSSTSPMGLHSGFTNLYLTFTNSLLPILVESVPYKKTDPELGAFGKHTSREI